MRVDGQDDKGLAAGKYMPRRGDAVRRAKDLEARHRGNAKSFPHDNPSSGMYRLVMSVDPSVE